MQACIVLLVLCLITSTQAKIPHRHKARAVTSVTTSTVKPSFKISATSTTSKSTTSSRSATTSSKTSSSTSKTSKTSSKSSTSSSKPSSSSSKSSTSSLRSTTTTSKSSTSTARSSASSSKSSRTSSKSSTSTSKLVSTSRSTSSSKPTSSSVSSSTVKLTSTSANVTTKLTSASTTQKSSTSSPVSTSAKSTSSPNSTIDSALIVATVQKRVESDYNLMGTAVCIQSGYTTDCQPPWIYTSSWQTFTSTIARRTGVYGWCYQDTTYFGDSYNEFWGWGSSNITSMLIKTGTYASAYAVNTCLQDSQCSSAYPTPQSMFDSYFQYINSTFSANIVTALKAKPRQTFCPPNLSGGLNFITNYLNPSNERFGVQNSLYIPGMFDKIDTSTMQTRSEMSDIQLLSAASLEAVFLYMVYGATEDQSNTRKRNDNIYSDEIYPGCFKQDFVLGRCKDIVPPREWDLNGQVVPTGERLRNSTSESSDLQERDCAASNTIQGYIDALANLKALKATTDVAINTAGLAKDISLLKAADWGTAVTVSTPSGPAVFTAAVVLGTAWYILDTTVNICDATGACDYIPTFVIEGVKAADNITSSADFQKAAQQGDLLTATFGIVSDGTDLLLDDAQSFYNQAKQCCAVNCDSTACQQASMYVMTSWLHLDCYN